MLTKISLNTYNLTFININSVITECEVDIIDDLYKFKLLDNIKFNNKDTKKVFYYYIIKKLCDILLDSHEVNKIVFWFNESGLNNTSIVQYTSSARWKTFINTVIRKLKSMFPMKFYISDDKFSELHEIIESDPGRTREIVQTVHESFKTFKVESYTFSKIKQFINNYELTFLDKHYFNQVKVKAIMYK